MSLEARLITVRGNSLIENATNQAMIQSVSSGSSPALIFYEMTPSVSIGRSQHSALDVDVEACRRNNVALARRNSGGQAVYIDNNYIVLSLVAQPNLFGSDLTQLRKKFSLCMAETLQMLEIPATFYEPDNVVVNENGIFRTMGNSGQIITSKAILVEGSLRYSHEGFDKMIDTLKTNGLPLHNYKKEIKEVLSAVRDYREIDKEEIKKRLVTNIARTYGLTFFNGTLSLKEEELIKTFTHPATVKQYLRDNESYKSRGVCYLFLNGQNLVDGMRDILPYNPPSTVADSTSNVMEVKNAC